MSCIKIRLKNIPNVDPVHLHDDGFAYLHLNTNTELSLNKQLSELSEINDIPFNYIINISLTATPKNVYLLLKFHHADNKPIPVQIFNGTSWLSPVYLSVTNSNAETLNIKFILTDLLWAKTLSEKLLCDLRLQEYKADDIYKTNAETDATNYIYQDGEQPYYFPLVDYGDLRNVFEPEHKDDAYILIDGRPVNQCAANLEVVSSTILPDVYVFIEEDKVVFQVGSFYNMELEVTIQGYTGLPNRYVFIGRKGKITLPVGLPMPVTLVVRGAVHGVFFTNTPVFGVVVINRTGSNNIPIGFKSVNQCDLRPLHFVYPILREIFCGVGFELVSPILNSEYGRRMLTYILDDKLSEDSKTYNISGPSNTPIVPYQGLLEIIQFNEIGVFDITVDIAATVTQASGKPNVINGDSIEDAVLGFYVWVFEGPTPITYYDSNVLYSPSKGNITYNFSLNDVVIKTGQSLRVFVAGKNCRYSIKDSVEDFELDSVNCIQNPDVTNTNLSAKRKNKFFWVDLPEPKKSTYVDCMDLVQRDTKQLDYVKAIAHILNLKFYTDIASKKIHALQPYDADLYGEVLDGFYQFDLDDLNIIPETHDVDSVPNETKYHHIKFREDNLHSFKIDVNPEIETGLTVTHENLLFKATPLHEYGIRTVSTGIGFIPNARALNRYFFPNTVEIESVDFRDTFRPIFGDDEYVVLKGAQKDLRVPTFDTSMFILLNYGRRIQIVRDAIKSKVHGISDYIASTMWGTAVHYHPSLAKIEGETTKFGLEDFSPTEKTLLFKFKQPEDEGVDWLRRYSRGLVEILHYEWVQQLYKGLKVSYLLDNIANDFHGNTLRKVYNINHLGKPYKVIIKAIDDYKTCKKIPSVYTLQSLPFVNTLCGIYDPLDIETEWRGGGGPDDPCATENQPQVTISYDINDDIIYLSLGGLNTSPVSHVLFEYSLDGTTWYPIDNTSIITAELPFISGYDIVYIRATVEYDDDCFTTVTTPVTTQICNYLLPDRFDAIIYQKPNGDVCVKATITIPNTITYTVNSFTIDLGNGPVPYTNDQEICGIVADVTFRLFTTINGCPEVYQEKVLVYEDSDECPTIDDIGLECGDGIIFIRTGVLPVGVVLFDRVYYQTSTDGVNWGTVWYEWFGDPITAPYVRARRVVEMCGPCEDICTPIIYCESDCDDIYEVDCESCIAFVTPEPTGCTISWVGPDGFTETGNNVELLDEGNYTVTIVCAECSYVIQYYYDKAASGISDDDPIILTD